MGERNFIFSSNFLFAVFLLSYFCYSARPNTRGQQELDLMDKKINELKQKLKALDDEDSLLVKAELWANLGALLQVKDVRVKGGGYLKKEALECFNNALVANNNEKVNLDILVNHRKGLLLKMMGRGEEAIESHDIVINLATSTYDQATALFYKGEALGMLGRVDQAIEHYKKALTIRPDQLASYLNLVRALREANKMSNKEWTDLVTEMQVALKKWKNNEFEDVSGIGEHSVIAPEDNSAHVLGSEIYWALFEATEKIKNYKLAWKYLEEAHRIEKGKRDPFSSEYDEEQTDNIRKIFQRGFWPADVGLDTMVPVFIVGMMRSGSTLLETMLDAHPKVFGIGEDSVFNPAILSLRDELLVVLGEEPENIKKVKKVVEKHGKQISMKMMSIAKNNTQGTPREGKIKRVVDKMLFNYKNIGFIHLVFPNAVILHTVRDPLDTLLSCYKHKFDDSGLEWSLDVHHLVTVYTQYLEIMHHYRTVLPDRVLDVSYEQLVADPEKIMRSVISRLKLDWDPKILEFYKTNRTVQTHSMAQVRHNISSKAIGGWRSYAAQLTPMVEALRKRLKPMLAKGALPFSGTMNWKLDGNFAYGVNDKDKDIIKQKQKLKSRGNKKNVKSSSSSDDGDSEDSIEDVEVDVDGKSLLKSKKRNKQTKTNSKNNSKKKRKSKGVKDSSHKKKKTSKRPQKKERSTSGSKVKSPKKSATAPGKASSANKAVRQQGTKQQLEQLLQTMNGVADKSYVRRLMTLLSAPTGDPLLDELVATGYVLLNNHRLAQAIDLFQKLIALRDDVVGAYVGLGTGLGLSRRFEESLAVFNRLLEFAPESIEGHERRAEVYSALGRGDQSQLDLAYIISQGDVGVDASSYINARVNHAKTLQKDQKPFAAYEELKDAHAKSLASPGQPLLSQVLVMMGKCEKDFGDSEIAISSLKDAVSADPASAEAYLTLAIAYMEISRWKDALPHLEKALQLEPRYKMVYGYRGLMYQNLGRSKDALADFNKAIDLDPNEPSSMLLSANCLHALGRLSEAAGLFDRMMAIDPNHDCGFQREVTYFYYNLLDEDVSSFNVDVDMDIKVKEGWLQHSPWTSVFPATYVSDVARTARAAMKKVGDQPVSMSGKAREMLALTTPLAKWVQLDTPGFMPNERQHRMFGLSVLQMAQLLRKHVRERLAGREGVEVTDSSSSRLNWVGRKQSKRKGYHVFGWRDLYDMVIRWRQVSEPLDSVWWNDGLNVRPVGEQLGLKTHMMRGSNKIIRYFPYLAMGFNLTQHILLTTSAFTPEKIKAVKRAKTIEELFFASGGKSFFVTTLIESLVRPGETVEGTRLTLQTSSAPEGYDFFINSGTGLDRYERYAEDMNFTFHRFIDALSLVLQGEGGGSSSSSKVEERSEAAFQRALEMFYYWVNYAPLSRGTSATGYAVLMACVVAMGEEILDPVPKGKQLDWEGIFTLIPRDFVARVSSWFTHRGPTAIPKKWLDAEPGYDARVIFNTTRNMMAAIGALE